MYIYIYIYTSMNVSLYVHECVCICALHINMHTRAHTHMLFWKKTRTRIHRVKPRESKTTNLDIPKPSGHVPLLNSTFKGSFKGSMNFKDP